MTRGILFATFWVEIKFALTAVEGRKRVANWSMFRPTDAVTQ